MDGRTDESDFIGHCPTNVERPISDLFKVNNGNSKKDTQKTKTPDWHQWCRSGVFIVNFEHNSLFSSVEFEQVNISKEQKTSKNSKYDQVDFKESVMLESL